LKKIGDIEDIYDFFRQVNGCPPQIRAFSFISR